MILFDLRCSKGHDFDGWFRDGATFDRQAEAHAISCSICGDTDVSKALMTPAVASGSKRDEQRAARALTALREMRRHIESNFDHVGRRFPEEARKIHYGEAERRGIYGEATQAEAKELVEEGVEVSPIPWLPPHDS